MAINKQSFAKKFAENGQRTVWEEAQYKLGWETVGIRPPTKEQFNYLFYNIDEKLAFLLGAAEGTVKTTDPVLGGPNGIANRQAKELAARTQYLKKKQEEDKPGAASTTKAGIVQLSSATNSNSEEQAATPKAVKTAYDKAVAAESAASGAVKTTGNQTVGGEKTFTGTAFFKAGAFVADSVGDFAANQCLQIGANNVNTYLYNKRSGKYLSMRNDGELRYDGKRLLDASDLLGMVPSGTVLYFAGSSAPAGWLKANGAAVSRTAYAALFAAIGTTYGLGDGRSTFNLPDLRGEFIRGWDDGRGVDTPRPMGSAQADAVRQHYHGIGYISPNNDDGAFVVRNWTTTEQQTMQFINGNGNSAIRTLSASSNLGTTNAIDESAGETRPRNVALLAIIKI